MITTLTEEQQAVEDVIFAEAFRSFPVYAERYLKIQDTEGNLVKFQINEVQSVLEEIIDDIISKKRLTRLIILKARREGVSTWATGRIFWKTANASNRYAVLVTHEPEATDFLFKMQKRYYDNLIPEFKPTTKYNNAKMLEFNTPDGKGLDSAIRVGTAGKSDFGSAQLIHQLLISELSKFPIGNQNDILTSLLQCVPDEQDTFVVIESTAKGIGGTFYDRYIKARYQYEFYLEDGKTLWRCNINEAADINNMYSSIFIPWFVFKRYRSVVPDNFVQTEKERSLCELYGVTNEQLQWRRETIANKCDNSEDIFAQEYPSNDVEAFLTSGRNVFDQNKLMALKKYAPEPKVRYECQLSTGHFLSDKEGRLQVWLEPVAGRSYVIAADVSEGLEKGDFSCADVVDQLTGQQVAQWHGKIAPDLFGVFLVQLARRYNQAWLVPERNNHGLTTITKIQDMGYKARLYVERVIEPPHNSRKRYGWLTSKKTKYSIIDNLVKEIRDDSHGIQCADTFSEMMTFSEDSGTMGASGDRFDDRVMSIAIAKWIRTRLPMFKGQQVYDNNWKSISYGNISENGQSVSVGRFI